MRDHGTQGDRGSLLLKKRPISAKILRLGHCQDLVLVEMTRYLKLSINSRVINQNVNIFIMLNIHFFQMKRMPPFLVLIINYSSKVCLISRELKEMDSSETFNPGLDAT